MTSHGVIIADDGQHIEQVPTVPDRWNEMRIQAEEAFQSRRYVECLAQISEARQYIQNATLTNSLQQTPDLQCLASLARRSSQLVVGMSVSGAGWRVTDTHGASNNLPIEVDQQLRMVRRTSLDAMFSIQFMVDTLLFSISPIHGQGGVAHLERESNRLSVDLDWEVEHKFNAMLALVYGYLHGAHLQDRAISQLKFCQSWLENCQATGSIDDVTSKIWKAKIKMAEGDISLNLRSATRSWGLPSQRERLDNEYLHRNYIEEENDCIGCCRSRPDIFKQIESGSFAAAHDCFSSAEGILRSLTVVHVEPPYDTLLQHAECRIRLAFLLVSQGESSAPLIVRTIWIEALTMLQAANSLFVRARCVEGQALCMAQIELINALLDPPLTQKRHLPMEWRRGSDLYDVSKQLASTTSFPYAVSLGHFCANVGRRWLTMFGQGGAAHRCHTLAVHIFDGAGAVVAHSMSIATRSALCFHFGPKILTVDAVFAACHSIRQLIDQQMLIISENVSLNSLLSTSAEQVLRSLDAHFSFIGIPTASSGDKTLAADMLYNSMDLYSNVTQSRNNLISLEYGHIGNLRSMIGMPDVLPPLAVLVPPSFLRYARNYTAEARWSEAKMRFEAARNAEENFEKNKMALLALCNEHSVDEDGGLVHHFLRARYHLINQQYEDAIQHYEVYIRLLLDWQKNNAGQNTTLASQMEIATLQEACKWAWYCHHADHANQYLQRLPHDESFNKSWILKAIEASSFALRQDPTRARHLYERALAIVRTDHDRARNQAQRMALQTDEDILRVLFGAAILYIDPRMEARPAGQEHISTLVYSNDQESMEWCMYCLELTRSVNILRASTDIIQQAEDIVDDPLLNLVDQYQGSPLHLRALMESIELQQASQRGGKIKSTASPIVTDSKSSATVTIKQLQDVLPKDALLLIYSFFDNRLIRFAIPAIGVGQPRLDCTAVQAFSLRHNIHQLLETCTTPAPRDRIRRNERHHKSARARNRLSSILLGSSADKGLHNLVSSWPSIKKLLIVPHGELHSLPFDVLPISKEEALGPAEVIARHKRIVDRFDLRLFPSCSLVLEVLQSTIKNSTSELQGGKVLLIGNPEKSDEGRNLPKAEQEVCKIWEKIGAEQSVLLVGADATHEVVYRHLRQPIERQVDTTSRDAIISSTHTRFRYIHFACHAHINEVIPSMSALVLANGECLYADQIRRLDLRGCNVFINACSSAETVRLPGQDAMHSIASAFLQAGASSVLANLWPVLDKIAVKIALIACENGLIADQSDSNADSPTLLVRRHLANENRIDLHLWAPLVIYGSF